jgi:hypothetical protein
MIAYLFNRPPTVLLVIVAILALATSFFFTGLVRAFLGVVCVVCSPILLRRAMEKSARSREDKK